MNINLIEGAGILLFIIGFYGILARRNIVKSILSLGVMEIGVIVFFLGINYSDGMRPPIGNEAIPPADPVPQALMITAIVIGVAVTAAALMMFIVLYHRYGTTNWNTAKKIREKEEER